MNSDYIQLKQKENNGKDLNNCVQRLKLFHIQLHFKDVNTIHLYNLDAIEFQNLYGLSDAFR
jgi:hypothetical protein